ncbi:MAG: hypothetical protein Q4F02_01130 [Candidatus Saccharibacteria bacterium]|nr:hypothetical protein [Candidatus Saccharibacteria bacterium]
MEPKTPIDVCTHDKPDRESRYASLEEFWLGWSGKDSRRWADQEASTEGKVKPPSLNNFKQLLMSEKKLRALYPDDFAYMVNAAQKAPIREILDEAEFLKDDMAKARAVFDQLKGAMVEDDDVASIEAQFDEREALEEFKELTYRIYQEALQLVPLDMMRDGDCRVSAHEVLCR